MIEYEDRPDREPDLVCPEVNPEIGYACKIMIWVKENRIAFCHDNEVTISNRIRVTYDPCNKFIYDMKEYIEYMANNPEDLHQKFALEYLTTIELEKAVFGE